MMKNDYDLVVIGGTKQGFFCAEYAVKLGARVALVIDNIDSSIELFQSEYYNEFLWLNNQISFTDFLQETKRIIDNKILPELELLGVDIIFSECKFIQEKQLILSTNRRQLKSCSYLLAMTASQLFIPVNDENEIRNLSPLNPPLLRGEGKRQKRLLKDSNFDLINYSLTLKDLFNEEVWNNLPEELTIFGDNINTIYLVNKLSQNHKKISLISPFSQILPSEDEDISYQLQLFLEGKGIQIYLNRQGIKYTGDDREKRRGKREKEFLKNPNSDLINYNNDTGLEFDHEVARRDRVITSDDNLKTQRVITLRKNLSIEDDNLGLTKLGIKNNGGKIEVNSKLQTKHPQIYACGDLLGGYALESLIPYEAKIAVNNALFFPYQEIDYSEIPYTLNTNPPINRLGYTEKQAQFLLSQNIKVLKIYCLLTSPINWQQEITFIKIIVDESNYLLGFHSFGFGVEELITAMTFIKKRNLPLNYLFKISFANLHTQKLVIEINNHWTKEHKRRYQIILDLAETFFIWKRY